MAESLSSRAAEPVFNTRRAKLADRDLAYKLPSSVLGGYDGTTTDSEKPTGIIGGILGALVTPIAVIWAIMSGGAGHGDYVAARVLYPLPMLLAEMAGEFSLPMIIFALAQFPVYGIVVGTFWRSGLILILAIHFIALAICFSGFISNFS